MERVLASEALLDPELRRCLAAGGVEAPSAVVLRNLLGLLVNPVLCQPTHHGVPGAEALEPEGLRGLLLAAKVLQCVVAHPTWVPHRCHRRRWPTPHPFLQAAA